MKEAINYNYQHYRGFCGRKMLGATYCEEREIWVNFKMHGKDRRELLDTLIHESLHSVYPEFDERETRAMTKAMLPTLTKEQEGRYFTLYDRKRTPKKR